MAGIKSDESDRDELNVAKALAHPRRPERICWGCDKYCPAADLACGNGTIRTPHPAEIFGDDWLEWEQERKRMAASAIS